MRLLSLLCLLPTLALARDFPVADVAAFDAAVEMVEPGDAIILREGEWKDAVLRLQGAGTAAAPITLRAAASGKVILTGKSALRLGGEWLIAEGLWLQDPDTTAGDAIEFRIDSKRLARHCRLTHCAITRDAKSATAAEAAESRWIGIYGANNRVDHCLIQGKTNQGATLVVWLGAGNEGRHEIDHNYFGPRARLGRNGGETIRIGDSATSMQTAACVVEQNLFEKCNGEIECISNKSCGNIYRGNTFLEVGGTLTLRHGNGCVVEGNAFLGRGAKGTGGIRIIGEDHVVRGNYLEKLTGSAARAGICFMMGIPNSPANRYFQVKRARVEGNTLVDCQHPIYLGLSDDVDATLPPVQTILTGNKISAPQRTVIEARGATSGLTFSDNAFFGQDLGLPPTEGITWKPPAITPLPPMARDQVGPAWWVEP